MTYELKLQLIQVDGRVSAALETKTVLKCEGKETARLEFEKILRRYEDEKGNECG